MRLSIVDNIGVWTLVLMLSSNAALAQSEHQHPETEIGTAGPPHSAVTANASQTSTGSDGSMNHASMRMQGGRAPENARDPHAYADGYTLTDGPYALPGPRQLVLADEHRFRAVLGDRLEYDTDNETGIFDLQAWYGTTYNRATIKLEGDIASGSLEESRSELLWSRALTGYLDAQVGVRLDQFDAGRNRQWLAVGVQGLAPYWFEVDLTAYLGEQGRTALSFEAEYDLLLSQRLILQPRAELDLYGQRDDANGLGSGLSDAALGVRLRFEFSRQFAPYVGVEWRRSFGDTADFARAAGESVRDTRYLAGVRFWF